jgi:hypothetical protein
MSHATGAHTSTAIGLALVATALVAILATPISDARDEPPVEASPTLASSPPASVSGSPGDERAVLDSPDADVEPLPTASAPAPAVVPTPVPTSARGHAMPDPGSVTVPGSRGPAGPTHPPASIPRQFAEGSSAAVDLVGTWYFDLYDSRAPRYQEPDKTACTAASTVSMLNTIAYDGWDATLVWQPDTSYRTQERVLAFERDHMTMIRSHPGSDPHGWRNALNYFGWGSLTADVYRDAAYSSQSQAEKAAISALARYRKPVGILSQYGAHAQFITGYRVVGHDPASGSLDFTVLGVYLTDPWRSGRYRDEYVSYARWQWGFNWLRFNEYRQTDSPYRDPIDGRVGRTEWYGKWVIVEPAR